MNTRLLWLHALSPLHCGTGQAVGGIDLPIAREKPTGLPLVPGSSLKGVLRSRGDDGATHRHAFGPDTANAADHAGMVQFSDLLLGFLPVRSVTGTFAYVTSPYVLRRLARDWRETLGGALLEVIPAPAKVNEAVLATNKLIVANTTKVVFEDLDFVAGTQLPVEKLAQALKPALPASVDFEFFRERLCVVHDDAMALLVETCTEITSRNRLNADSKTVETGGLWTEEALPVETLLFGVVVATPVKPKAGEAPRPEALLQHVEALTRDRVIQIGGKASVGRGLCSLKMSGGKA